VIAHRLITKLCKAAVGKTQVKQVAQDGVITMKNKAEIVDNVRRSKLLAIVSRTADDFQHPIRWGFPPDEGLIDLSTAQDQVMQITNDLEWLAGELQSANKRKRDRATARLEGQTLVAIKQLRTFAKRHEETYPFTAGFDEFFGELGQHVKAIRALKRDWKSLRPNP
jgi:hypothetical protein